MFSEDLVNQCPACGSETLDTDIDIPGGICRGCGLVYDGSEWAANPIRGGKMGMQSELENATRSDWRDEVTIRDASDQQLVRILSWTDDLADRLSLKSEERESAAELAVEVWDQNLMHGRELESVIAGVMYTTCRKSGQPRPSHTIADAAKVCERKLRDASKMIKRELDLQINPPGPKEYIPHLNRQFVLPNHVQKNAFEILQDTETTSGNPAAIAAAALYTATQDSDSLTLQTAGKAAGVSKETVWRHSTEFE